MFVISTFVFADQALGAEQLVFFAVRKSTIITMQDKKPANRARGIFQILMLALFLIGLPLGSYIYLKKGYEYQKAAMSELSKEHQLPDLSQWQPIAGALPDTLMEKMYLVGFLNPDRTESVALYGDALVRLHEQFDIPTNIKMITLLTAADSAWVEAFENEHQLNDPKQLIYLQPKIAEQFNQTALAFGMTEEQVQGLALMPAIAMVDDSLYVRKIYQVNQEDELKRLVEQTAILLPERSRPKPVLKRETEK